MFFANERKTAVSLSFLFDQRCWRNGIRIKACRFLAILLNTEISHETIQIFSIMMRTMRVMLISVLFIQQIQAKQCPTGKRSCDAPYSVCCHDNSIGRCCPEGHFCCSSFSNGCCPIGYRCGRISCVRLIQNDSLPLYIPISNRLV